MNTLVHFDINNRLLELEDVLYIGQNILIAKHPKTLKYVLFIRNNHTNINDKEVQHALRKCGLRLKRTGSYQGISYKELEAIR